MVCGETNLELLDAVDVGTEGSRGVALLHRFIAEILGFRQIQKEGKENTVNTENTETKGE